MKKVIAFSLWGNDPKYCVGAVRNAELAAIHYPDWECRFYVSIADILYAESELCKALRKIELLPNTKEIAIAESPNWHGMFWRFLPASEDDVDVFISRDCDSRLSAREAAAVNEWLQGPRLVHSMADHPYHFHPRAGLMGGMFGMKRHACPEMSDLIEKFKAKYSDAWQCDQDFLRDYIFPPIANKIHPTSDIHHGCYKFQLPRLNGSFIGEIIGPNEEILHPEHRERRNAK